jgi:hypothetical protein
MPAGPEVLELSSHDLLQHMAIWREIGHQPFELRVFLAELPEFPQFTEAQPRILAFPHVERLLADAHIATDFRNRRPALRLPQRSEHLFLGMSTSSCHRWVLLPGKKTPSRAGHSRSR